MWERVPETIFHTCRLETVNPRSKSILVFQLATSYLVPVSRHHLELATAVRLSASLADGRPTQWLHSRPTPIVGPVPGKQPEQGSTEGIEELPPPLFGTWATCHVP